MANKRKVDKREKIYRIKSPIRAYSQRYNTTFGVIYDLDGTDPTLVAAITFDIAPTSVSVVAALVEIQTVDAGDWTEWTLGVAVGNLRPVT